MAQKLPLAVRFLQVLVLGVFVGSFVGVGAGYLVSERWERNMQGHLLEGNTAYPRTELHGEKIPDTIGQITISSGHSTLACTGTLVGPALVLSAGHCFTHGADAPIQIHLGMRSPYDGTPTEVCTLALHHIEGGGKILPDEALLDVTSCAGDNNRPGDRYGYGGIHSRSVQTGEAIRLQGYPASEKIGSSWEARGVVAGHCRYLCNTERYVGKIRISGGVSGAAVLNDKGTIVGIVAAVDRNGDTLIQEIRPVLVDKIVQRRDWAKKTA